MRDLSAADILYILAALRWTLALSAVAFIGGLLFCLPLALARTSEYLLARLPAIWFIRIFQGTPLLIQLLFVFFFLPLATGTTIPPWVAAATALTLHASAYLGDILRGGIQSIDIRQTEAGRMLGLRKLDTFAFVILPQAVRLALPSLIGFLVQLIKGTSLCALIGFVELTKAAQSVNSATFEPGKIFPLVALLYFILCWPLSLLGQRYEQRFRVKAF